MTEIDDEPERRPLAESGRTRDIKEGLRNLGFESVAQYRGYQESLNGLYMTALHGLGRSWEERLDAGGSFVAACIEELDELKAVPKETLDQWLKELDSKQVPSPALSMLRNSQDLLVVDVQLPGVPEGGSFQNWVSYEPSLNGVKLILEQACRAALQGMKSLIAECAHYMHTTRGPDGEPLMEWKVKMPDYELDQDYLDEGADG
jgi:hypothetical protein